MSLIAILVSLVIFTIIFVIVFNRLKIAQVPTSQSGKDPRVETQETIDKVIEQQNKDKVQYEQTDQVSPRPFDSLCSLRVCAQPFLQNGRA